MSLVLRTSRTPFVRTLLVVLVAVFVGEELLGGSTRLDVLVRMGALEPGLVAGGQYWRVVTCAFLHVGFFHLLINCWALYQLGTLFELWMGSRPTAIVYLGSAVGGSLASLAFTRAVSAGASGAVFGLLGALMVVLVRRRDRLTPQARSLLTQLTFWAGLNLVFGLSIPAIDNAAHLGGFVVGGLISLGLKTRTERRHELGY